MSDDGALNSYLLDPEQAHVRTYLAQVENIPSVDQLKAFAQGVVIEGKITKPAKIELLAEEPLLPPRAVPIRVRKNIPTAWVKVTLTEGRNRQVRKMTAAVGCPTLRLVREAIGALHLLELNLAPGEIVKLCQAQIVQALS